MLTISDFRLSEVLHDGGLTRVYRATRIVDGRPVVLKILSEGMLQPATFSQYQREYEITRTLNDIDGVIKVFDLVPIQDSLMIVEEDIGACSLRQILAEERPDLKQALRLSIRLAHILEQIHQHRIIHKDFNPANILWNRASDELRVIDFGIASQLNQERQEFQNPNQLEGSLAYISPEQTGRVNQKLDYRSDLYSLGISLYQLFTGTLPFNAQEGIELVHAHIALIPVAPHQLDAEIPVAVSQIIMRLIEKMADSRYQSAAGAKHDFERCLAQLEEKARITVFPLAENDVPTRFQIPQKLYGREHEVLTITRAFDRVAQGPSALLLISGFSGIGKSALVHEVHKPLTAKCGSFISGKFDQYQRDVPFYAWTLAFEGFCQLLLKENEASLTQWRNRITLALGSIGKVITDIIPSIELIIGKQAEIPPLSGEQALNRLNYAFSNFIRAVCLKEHPLIIFIDDWQWADAGSLSLLKFVMSHKESQYLLLIGAYRDNEINSVHPLSLALEEIKKDESRVSEIHLQSLKPADVHHLLQDALNDAPGLESVSCLLYEKTQGNAFFLVQLLADLYEKSAITFDRAGRHWTWQQSAIESMKVADNVVELMTGKIGELPERTQHALIYASCIGDRFDLRTLSRILKTPAHEAAADLDIALQEGILLPVGVNYRFATQRNNTADASYQFIHDRVRQAAYGMLAKDASEQIHYDIAGIWLAESGLEVPKRNIFDIANQYNAGRRMVTQRRQKDELLAINLQAGKKAREATAYPTALNYLQTALELRDDNCWQAHAEQSAALFLLASEAAFLTKNYAAMELWLDEFLSHTEPTLARVQAYKIRLQAYVAQNRLSEAVDVALHALTLLGIVLPKSPGGFQVLGKLIQTKLAMKGKTFADLHALPEMTDPYKLSAMDLLGLTIPPAYWTSQELVALTVFQMVNESIQHGYSPNAGYGFSWWGITESAMLGNIDKGYQFGEFAIELATRHGLNLQQPLFFFAWIIRKFKRPLTESLAVFEKAYTLSLEKGDFEYASYARNNQIQTLFHTGRSLNLLLPEMEQAHRDLLRFQIGSSLYWHDICWQTTLNFVNGSTPIDVLGGPAYDEAVSLPQHLKVKDASTLFLLYCAKLMLSYFFNDIGKALVHAQVARKYLKAGVGMPAFVLFHFYESLALLADAHQKPFFARQRILFKVAANQKKLQQWAVHAPMNHQHHWHLVEAERLRVSGKADEAQNDYNLAIDHARENGFIHEEALASELSCRYHLQRQQNRLAAYYLRQSLQLYDRWGATAKSAQLRAAFPTLLLTAAPLETRRTADSKTSYRGSSGAQTVEPFDLAAVTQSSQAISSEIVFDKLITTLLKIVIEHSGAQKALLILNHSEQLRIEAQGFAGQAIAVTVNSIPLDGQADVPLPQSMIQYVSRTLKSQVIDDAQRENSFSRDPYLQKEQPLSVLCEPIIRQGKLMGILYLENNLTAGAFTAARLQLLRLLSSQAAISIENANVYRLLEQKVKERTQKLQASLLAEEQLNVELQASSVRLEAAHAQLRDANRLLQQRADTDGLTGLANRRYFNERLSYELDRCSREQQFVTLFMCDLDNFKRFNDTYGHVDGDTCLQNVAKALKMVFIRATDLVARYGGEEFVVLLPMTDPAQAAKLGQHMRQAVESLQIPHSGNGQYGVATISIGAYSLVPTPDTTATAVIEQADKALYQSKKRGRNCLVQLQ